MRCDVLTLFPAAVEAYLSVGVIGQAAAKGVLDLRVHDLRRWAVNRYGQVDDEPFGGGPGMVMMAPAVVPAVRELAGEEPVAHVVLPDARGRRFTDGAARELAVRPRLLFVCGRYEGFDERIHEALAADEISLGDFVLSGGELAALAILDAVARHVPGVVGDAGSVAADSFTSGLLDHPVYTRPRSFEGRDVPDVLVSGHHADVANWRLRESLRATLRRRPDLVDASWEALPARVRAIAEQIAAAEGIGGPPFSRS
ncbi:MAG: tRNA (guanosine(37)-N1)-methyltransferase TrmD [Acidobacteriota bacterium]